jgi:hypothetical protein
MATSDFLYVDVLGDRNLLRNLDQMPDTVRAILLDKVAKYTEQIADDVRDNIINRLNQKTGQLLAGVKTELRTEGVRIDGRVYIAGSPHAMVQEKGAVTPPHMIFPRNGKVLAFLGATGHKVFATRVFHPGGQIPAHHFLKDAFRANGPAISRGIKNAVVQGIRAKMRQG